MSAPAHAPRVVGLGIACLDYVFRGEGAEKDGHGRLLSYVVEGGGLVATALAAAARLGARAEIVTWVGDDQAGQFVLEGLRAEGVDVRRASVVAKGHTAVSFIHVEAETGARTIYHRRGVESPGAAVEQALLGMSEAEAALVDGTWPQASIAFARKMKGDGVPVVGDFCPDEARRELAGLVDALIVSRECAERLLPRETWEGKLRALAAMGSSFVAITAGDEGCYWLSRGEVLHRPAYRVQVVDTTGAGDVFHGAFAYGLARKWSYERCTTFASAAAALSCRALGGREAIPTLGEVESLMTTGAGEAQV